MSSSLDQRTAKPNENTADKMPQQKEEYSYPPENQNSYPHGGNAANADAYMGYYWSPYQNNPNSNNNMQSGYEGREGVYGGYPPNDYMYNQYDYSYWYQNVDPSTNSWNQQQQQYYKSREFANGDSFYSGGASGSNHNDYNNNGSLQSAQDSFKNMSLTDEDKDFPSNKTKSWANVVNSSKILPRSKTIPPPPHNYSKGDPSWDKSKFSRQVAPGPYSALSSAASLEFQPNLKTDPPVDKPISSGDNRQMLDYNPKNFDLNPKGARFFVIKSFSEDDIHRSIKYSIWCSTEYGNKRLDAAFKERENKGQVYLFFSVNGSGHFCGVALMTSSIDYNSSAEVWAQNKWKGQFSVRWVYVKDVPNSQLRHIKLENNENKPVTNSRDTQEMPCDKGKQVLRIIHQYHHNTSIFDDFYHYERQQEETQLQRK